MTRRPLRLRTFTIISAACTTGLLAGDTATALSAHLGWPAPEAGKLATALVGLWTLHKLHLLVDDAEHGRSR